jgi:hypothetical protein
MIETRIKIVSTITKEGVYFITTKVGRAYVEAKLKDYLGSEVQERNICIEHLEAFGENDGGKIVISYDYNYPLDLFDTKPVKVRNSGYLRLYCGYGDYEDKYHSALTESKYGLYENVSGGLLDEDGFYKQVFVSQNGVKYHKNPLCFHIEVNAYPVILSTIPNKKPCEHCVVEGNVSPNQLVFSTATSNVYHQSPTCHAIFHQITTLSEKEALLKGYEPCKTCGK